MISAGMAREIIAGITTFLTMSYIVLVSRALLVIEHVH